jgi:hypothetical protein
MDNQEVEQLLIISLNKLLFIQQYEIWFYQYIYKVEKGFLYLFKSKLPLLKSHINYLN